MTGPLLVRPHYVSKPWGGRRLAELLGRTDLPPGPVGESWEVADTGAFQSVVEGGPHDGRPLRDVLGAPFPLLLKVLDAREPLSVQVHPDGRDGAPAKEEAWVALADGGAVAVGTVAPDVAPREILGRLRRISLAAGCPRGRRPPTVVHVPPGTVHAILGGALLLEVQNPVDATRRLFDHDRAGLDGRPRPLHREEAAALLARGAPPPATLDGHGFLAARRFGLEVVPPDVPYEGAVGKAAFFLRGGRVTWGGRQLEVPPGRSVVLPRGLRTLSSDGWIVVASA